MRVLHTHALILTPRDLPFLTILLGAIDTRMYVQDRGIFHNESKTALCWVNEEDHCRIISMEDGGNVKAVFTRFAQISEALKTAAEANGTKLM